MPGWVSRVVLDKREAMAAGVQTSRGEIGRLTAPVATSDTRTALGPLVLVGLAGILALIATVGAMSSVTAAAPWAVLPAAGFATLAGAALLWAGIGRAMREGRRRKFFLLFTIGGSIWLFGQAVGYTLSRANTTFDPRIEAIPLALGLPLAISGMIGLALPAAMDRHDTVDAALDALIGSGSLLVIWLVSVVPNWAPSTPEHEPFLHVDQVTLLVASITGVILISFSRRPGSLPETQLALFGGGIFIIITADVLGELGPDRQTITTVSLVGYWIGIAMIVLMLGRSATEVEPSGGQRLRVALAVGVPFGLLLVAGLLLIDLARIALPGAEMLKVMPVVWAIAVLVVGVSRAWTQRTERTERTTTTTADLAASAQGGWVSALLRDSTELVFVLDLQGSIVYSSPRAQQRLAVGHTFSDLLISTRADEFSGLLTGVLAGAVPFGPYDMRLHAADGSEREVETYLRVVKEVSFEGFVVTGTDVTDTRRLVERLDLSHQHDELTGLLTVEAFAQEVDDRLRTHSRIGVAALDLNDLGVWNETLGRDGGDALLQAVANRFDALPAEIVAVARLGGDRFGMLVVDDFPGQTIERALDRFTVALHGLLLPNDSEVDVSFLAGYSVTPPAVSAQRLMDQADVALRRARGSRNAAVVPYRAGMNDDLVRRLTSEQRIREALTGDRLEVHYQPVVSLQDGSVNALEALARIRGVDGALLFPGEFMAAAEHRGLVVDLDREVRRIVGRDWDTLADATGPDLRVTINVHEMELTPGLVTELLDSGLAQRVVVEVTEAALLTRPQEAVTALNTFRAAGGLVAIDDFGTGYSSLSQILALPCDILKIDRSFISQMSAEDRTMSLVRAIVQLGHDLRLSTVAEGVETAEELAALRAVGCDRVQGFWFARPMPLPEATRWLRDHSSG